MEILEQLEEAKKFEYKTDSIDSVFNAWDGFDPVNDAFDAEVFSSVYQVAKRFNEVMTTYNGLPMGVEFKHNTEDRFTMITPDSAEPGRFRLSYFDKHGFSSHQTFDTINESVEEMLHGMYHIESKGILSQLSKTVDFEIGNQVSTLINQFNIGKITDKEFADQRQAVYDAVKGETLMKSADLDNINDSEILNQLSQLFPEDKQDQDGQVTIDIIPPNGKNFFERIEIKLIPENDVLPENSFSIKHYEAAPSNISITDIAHENIKHEFNFSTANGKINVFWMVKDGIYHDALTDALSTTHRSNGIYKNSDEMKVELLNFIQTMSGKLSTSNNPKDIYQKQIIDELIKHGWHVDARDNTNVCIARLPVKTFRGEDSAKIFPITIFEDGLIGVNAEFITKGENALVSCGVYIKTKDEIPTKIEEFHNDVIKSLSQAYSVRVAERNYPPESTSFNIGEKVIITAQNQQAIIDGNNSENMTIKCNDFAAKGIQGEITHIITPSNDVIAKFGDISFRLKENYITKLSFIIQNTKSQGTNVEENSLTTDAKYVAIDHENNRIIAKGETIKECSDKAASASNWDKQPGTCAPYSITNQYGADKMTQQYPQLTKAEHKELTEFTSILKKNYPEVKDESITVLCDIAHDMAKYNIDRCKKQGMTEDKFNQLTDKQEGQIKQILDKSLPGTEAVLDYEPRGAAIKLKLPQGQINNISGYAVPEISKYKLTIPPEPKVKTATQSVSKKDN